MKSLAEVCGEKSSIVDGPFGSNLKSADFVDEGVHVMKIQNIKPFKLSEKRQTYITQQKAKELSRHSFKAEDILMTKLGSPLGACAVVPGHLSGVIVADLVRIRPPKGMERFLEYYLNSPRSQNAINERSQGTTRPRVRISDVRNLSVPFPPVEEQERIVEVLDEAFAAIDKAKANIERNLTNARELVQSKIENDLTLSAGSESVHSLSRLLDFGWIVSHQDGNHGSSYPRKAEFVGSGVQYISASCIENGQVNFEKAKHLTEERAKGLTKGVAQSGDVLFAHNATVGPVALLETKKEKVILGTSLTYYRCNPEFLFAPYLVHFMRSRAFVRQYESVMRQSTRNQVPITKQRLFHFHIPSIETQKVLAKNWDVMHSELREYSAKLKSKFEVLEELRQSILEQAFEGKLTEPVAA